MKLLASVMINYVELVSLRAAFRTSHFPAANEEAGQVEGTLRVYFAGQRGHRPDDIWPTKHGEKAGATRRRKTNGAFARPWTVWNAITVIRDV
jgi:hypothetical protein